MRKSFHPLAFIHPVRASLGILALCLCDNFANAADGPRPNNLVVRPQQTSIRAGTYWFLEEGYIPGWSPLKTQAEVLEQEVLLKGYYAAVEQSSALIEEAKRRPLTVRENFDLSLGLFGSGRFAEAAITAEIGIGQAKMNYERAALFGIIAQSRGALGDYREAADAALQGHRLSPLSKDLAAMRVVYWTEVGNGAQVAAAEDALAALEDSGERVFLGPMVKFIWANRKAILVVVTKLKPLVLEQVARWWPEHKTAIEAAVQTLTAIWAVTETTPANLPR